MSTNRLEGRGGGQKWLARPTVTPKGGGTLNPLPPSAGLPLTCEQLHSHLPRTGQHSFPHGREIFQMNNCRLIPVVRHLSVQGVFGIFFFWNFFGIFLEFFGWSNSCTTHALRYRRPLI